MKELYDIIMEFINVVPWFVVAYIIHEVYNNKPKHISINFKDIIQIESEK